MVKSSYSVEGMTCQNCVKHVEKVLTAMEGATNVAVSLEEKRADVEWSSDAPNLDQVEDVLEEAGFELKR
ncbi:MAG: heavy metal-associated domain-containing protein [Planctomycetota bacterium]|nr:heavy metal-associated domain-containing protein [Planctomycetota bacterium]